MTNLTNVFTNQKDEMIKVVNNIEVIGCVKNFSRYCATEINDSMSDL